MNKTNSVTSYYYKLFKVILITNIIVYFFIIYIMNTLKQNIFGGMINDFVSLIILFTTEINNIIYKLLPSNKYKIKIPNELLFISHNEFIKLIDMDYIDKNNIKIVFNKDNTILIIKSKYKKNILKNIHGTCWLISVFSILYNSDFIDKINENNNHNTSQLSLFIPNNKINLINPLIDSLIKHRKESCVFSQKYKNGWLNNNNFQTCSNNLANILNLLGQIYNYDKINGGDDFLIFIIINILCLYYCNKCISMSFVNFNQKDLINSQFKNDTLIGSIILSNKKDDGHATSLYKRNGKMYSFNDGLETEFNYEHFFESYKTLQSYEINIEGIPIISNNDNQKLIATDVLFFNICDLSDDFFNDNIWYFLSGYFNGCIFNIRSFNMSIENINVYVKEKFNDIISSEVKINQLINLCKQYNVDLSFINIKHIDNKYIPNIIKIMANVQKKNYFEHLLISKCDLIVDEIISLIDSNNDFIKNLLKLLLKYRHIKIHSYVNTNIIYYIYQIYSKLYNEKLDYANMIVRSFYKSLKHYSDKFNEFINSDEYTNYLNIISGNTNDDVKNSNFLKLVQEVTESNDIFVSNFNNNY
jgi:hypothetical protein